MKRWIVYLLVFIGVHIYFISMLNEASKPLQEWAREMAVPRYTIPNWNNPKQDDIFMVKDTLRVIRFYKIRKSLAEGQLAFQTGNYQFSAGVDEKFSSDKWNFDFLNDPALYIDSIQQISINDFLAIKEDAYRTWGFRLVPTKHPISSFLNMHHQYRIIFSSVIIFFIIWLFGFLNTYLSAVTRFSKQLLLGGFVILVIFFLWGDAPMLVDHPMARIYLYGRGLVYAFVLFKFIKFLNAKLIERWTFADQEAIKFVSLFLGGFVLSVAYGFMHFAINDKFEIDIFRKGTNAFNDWRFYISPFVGTFWLSIATGNFLNNFRKHFFQLRRKAKAFKYAQKKELEFKSELETLQAKINPHFLYNSLNSIASLAQSDPEKTESMALALSKFYKEKTNRKERVWSTVAEEIDMLKTYLAIEKIRFGDRLQVELRCSENAGAEKIPRFLLQPLIENAIKYGYNSENNKIDVKIFVEESSRNLTIRIIDSGPAFSEELHTGYGIRSVQKKLKLLYPDNHQMEFINHPEKQVFIQIKL